MNGILAVLVFCFLICFAILALIFLVVPLLKGIVWMIGGLFNGLGWVVRHVFEFVGGMLKDSVRFVGAIIAFVVLAPLVLLNVIIGRWSASGHFARSMKRECGVASTCLYRVLLQRPLRFALLGGLLEGLEDRVNEAVVAAPTSDKPKRRTGTFEGYTIVGSLPGGGSGAKLYIAEPDEIRRRRNPELPERVVIKSFAISEGSTLPQIVRESRALEAAKQLGLVFDHGMDEHRFFYVMPYHHGDHLGIVTRQAHGKSDTAGLGDKQLTAVIGYVEDLLQTLLRYHEGGLWHKDVKPDNIIIHSDEAHLVDLGLVTPLRSAMTLTTHGTEYFRDPEMVRMALRGVKVHQVDGAKFDIYAVGAVLYFVIENTFPAHGGLSRFAKRSPESLRWIIRRAMTDYNSRYETAAVMLADLQVVAAASNPWSVKPAHLPSMRGVGADAVAMDEPSVAPEPVSAHPQPEIIAAAGSPVPPTPATPAMPATPAGTPGVGYAGWGIAVGPGGVKAGRLGDKPESKPQPTPGHGPQRPNIRVTNWWTGAHDVLAGGMAGPRRQVDPQAAQADARTYRREVQAMREHAASLRLQVRHQAVTARRAAKEQIRDARARAKAIQRRAREHRYAAVVVPRRPAEKGPSAVMAFVAVTVAIAGTMIWFSVANRGSHPHEQVLAMGPPAMHVEAGVMGPLSLLLINDHPAAASLAVRLEIARLVKLHQSKGWEVVLDNEEAEIAVRGVLPTGAVDPLAPNPLLRNALLDFDFGGIIRIKSTPGDGPVDARIESVMIVLPDTEEVPLLRLVVPKADREE